MEEVPEFEREFFQDNSSNEDSQNNDSDSSDNQSEEEAKHFWFACNALDVPS